MCGDGGVEWGWGGGTQFPATKRRCAHTFTFPPRPRGSFVNISWRNISIVNPRYAAMYTNVFQEDSQVKQCFVPVNASRPHDWLSASSFSFSDIRATVNSSAGAYGGCFVCAPTRPCSGFLFHNVVVTDVAATPVGAAYVCDNVRFTSADSSPAPCKSR